MALGEDGELDNGEGDGEIDSDRAGEGTEPELNAVSTDKLPGWAWLFNGERAGPTDKGWS